MDELSKRPRPTCRGSHRTSPAVGARAAASSARPPKGSAHALCGNGNLPPSQPLSSTACAAPRSTSCARCPTLSRRRSTSSGRPIICGGGCGCGPGRGNTFRRTYLGTCCSCLRCCLRSIGRAVQTARDGGRGSPARSSSPKLAHPGQVFVRGLCASAEAFLWNRPQGRVLQRLRVGVSLTARSRPSRSGCATTCSKRSRGTEASSFYCCATSPAARSTPLRSARASRTWRCTALTSSRCRCPSWTSRRSPSQALKACASSSSCWCFAAASCNWGTSAKPLEHLRLVARF